MLRPSPLPWGLAASMLAATLLGGQPVCAGPSVDISMKAAFPSGPYLIELLETAVQENSSSYYPILDRIADGYFSDAKTDKQLYESFINLLQKDGHIPSTESLSTFKLALSTRSAAPKVEAHYQYYQTSVEPSLKDDQDGCGNWILWEGHQYCSASLDQPRAQVPKGQERDLPFDITLGSGPSCILYADITAPEFGIFHKVLAEKSRNRECAYKLRHRRLSHEDLEALPVSGYGVELALKRTDYIVIDDRKSDEDVAQKPISSGASEEIVLDDAEEVADLKPLSTSQLRDLGLKAGSFVMHSDNPFDTLLKLTQDFPKHSTSLASRNISQDFLDEHQANRASLVPSGFNVLWMNGVQLIERQMDAFALVDLLRRERKMIHGVMDLGLSGEEAVSLLGHNAVAEAKTEDSGVQRFVWHDEPEDGKVIIWLNNVEKDKRYESFPRSLMALMQGGMPGQLPQMRRDMFNLVIPVDLTLKNDTNVVINQLQDFVKRKLPVRFGVVPLTSTQASERQAKVVYHLVETYGLAAMTAYLSSTFNADKTGDANKELFEAAIEDRKLREDAEKLSFEEVLSSEHQAEQVRLSKHWAERLRADGPTPVLFVDGVPVPRDGNWVPVMGNQLGTDLQLLRQAVYFGEVKDGWLPEFFLRDAVSRRNTVVFPTDPKDVTILDVNKLHLEHATLFQKIPILEANPDSTKENWAVLTVIADLTNDEGLKIAGSAFEFRANNPGIRLDIIHNPAEPNGAHKINTALKMSQSDLAAVDSEDLLRTVLAAWDSLPDDLDYDVALQKFLPAAGIRSGQNVLVLNGRVVGPIEAAADFTSDDFALFLEIEQDSRILPVYKAIEDLGLSARVSGPLAAAKVTSITALSSMSDLPEGIFEKGSSLRISAFNVWNSTHTAFEVGDKSTATIQLVAVVDPASEQGQRWVPILKVLSELDGVYLKVFLNPKEKLDELPVKRFYRYVLDSAPTFDEAGKVKALHAEFKGLPSEALLNVGMDVPPAWLVASKVSLHDLDNLKLSSIKSDVKAIYELENILIEGHSREATGALPRGAQLVLATEKDPRVADTIIMYNLGYFQFKTNPGFYKIQLKEGRSSDIYYIESVGAKGYNAVVGDEGTDVVLMNFMGATLYPRINRKPGMEEEDVLDLSGSEGGALDTVSKGFKSIFGVKSKSASDEEHAEINIFSVASGHLYERMLNIMMASVMKNTKHTVKFWFIEQFLSPSFKDFIPYMAEEYGFKYEMVTYKWPHWLRQQKEKQREIWGYKILFLDVLFPLSLDKVIFVDADQIVRTDMYDLVQHDLEGKPYGFTPMCDSRVEMEGFRFWKQGYWANYLRGEPYHISALYVVDLRRFRELAAGDRLRQQYHTLSADPNSLSNLDQDLPNHMQFQIPIHSLPQEWLWCETWCSDETFPQARTIDLCNNPQTKEPKLDRARRQVPEWTEYDDEIAALYRRRRGNGKSGDDAQKPAVVRGDGETLGEAAEGVERNTKSRAFEGEEPAPTEHFKDEL